jgi:hypothetical protein
MTKHKMTDAATLVSATLQSMRESDIKLAAKGSDNVVTSTMPTTAARRSITTLLNIFSKDEREWLRLHTRTTSPPNDDGRLWLKNVPTITDPSAALRAMSRTSNLRNIIIQRKVCSPDNITKQTTATTKTNGSILSMVSINTCPSRLFIRKTMQITEIHNRATLCFKKFSPAVFLI